MESLPEYISEYKQQLKKGVIQKAYLGLMQYIMDLKTHFKKKYPEYSVSGSLYYGYMDMTYFALFPESLKKRGLKIAIVFVYETFRFEVWLSGSNRPVQAKYWQLFKDNDWNKYHLVPTQKGVDSIVEHVLADNPDFKDLEALTAQIESGTLKFIEDIESFLSQHTD
jgi:hypothetical protein